MPHKPLAKKQIWMKEKKIIKGDVCDQNIKGCNKNFKHNKNNQCFVLKPKH